MAVGFVELFLILLTAFVNIFLGIMVFKQSPKHEINRMFFLVCFLIGFWALCLLFYEFPIIFTSLFWIKATYVVVSLAVISVLRFSFIFPAPVYRRCWVFSYFSSVIYIGVTIWLLFFTNSWVLGVSRTSQSGLQTHLGTGYIVWSFMIWIEFGWALFNFVSNSLKLKGFQKAQLLYLFVGLGLWGVLVTFLDIILPIFFQNTRYFPISSVTSLFFTFAVSYTILRHRFLDIRIALQEIVVYFLTSVFSGAVMYVGALSYYILFKVPVRLEIIPLTLSIGFFLTLIFGRIVDFAKKIASDYLFLSVYYYENILQDLGIGFSTIIETKKLADVIVNTLFQSLRIDKAAVLIVPQKGKDYEIAKSVGFNEDALSKAQYNFLVSYIGKYPGVIVFDELQRFMERIKDEEEIKTLEKIKEEMQEVKVSLIVPIAKAEQMIGLIFLGDKRLGAPYTIQDINMLKFIADQAAIAFENSMLYNQLSDLNKNLKQKVDEKTAELKAKNVDLEKANEELKSLDKMKDQLIAITSHELKTPASIALNYLWMVLNQKEEKTNIDQKDEQRLAKSFVGIQSLVRLIDNILNVSKIEGGRIQLLAQVINTCDFIKDVVDELLTKAKQKGLALTFVKPKECFEIYQDPFWLKEVLRNLIINSIKYTDEGSVTVSLKKEKDKALFSISDTGRGIAKENFGHLFQKLWREDKSLTASTSQTGGTGLGLYITKSIINLMQGEIWADSKLGQGSTFYFSLSLKIPKAEDRQGDLKKSPEGVYYKEDYLKIKK
ncbi:MAG: ATP-binding protein [Patescibacteria group bacterium]